MFISKLSGNEVKPAQYLTELMAERKARKDGKPQIQAGFWRDDYWQEFYVQTIQAANSLLKLYSAEVIIAAVKDKRASWMYSLRTKSLKPILAEYEKKAEIQAKIEKEKQQQAEAPKPVESLEVQKQELRPQVASKKQNIISKLRNL